MGKRCVTETLIEGDYITVLDKKIGEELSEYLSELCLEELDDLTQVIYAVRFRGLFRIVRACKKSGSRQEGRL